MQYRITGNTVKTEADPGGWKSSASILAEALGGKWTRKAGGYTLSNKALADFQALASNGWKATRLWITGQKADFYHPEHGTKSRSDAVKLCKP